MRTMTCLIGAEHDIAVHLCNFIKDSRGSSRVLPYHEQKNAAVADACQGICRPYRDQSC